MTSVDRHPQRRDPLTPLRHPLAPSDPPTPTISDDEDVDVFVQTFKENPTSQFAELYVDIETSEEGVAIPTHGLHQSHYMTHFGTLQPTQSTVVHGEEIDYMVDEEPDNKEEQEEEDEDTLLDNDHDQNDSDTDDEYHGNPMSQQTDVTPFWNDIPHYEVVGEDYPHEDILAVEGLSWGPWARRDGLYLKQEFESKNDVQAAIKHYCMKEHHEAQVVESTTTKFSMKCRNHEQDMVKETPSIPVIMIQERVTAVFGYHVSYRKAWKAKQKAIAKIYSDWEESYAFLPRWFEYMLQFAPGSVYNIQDGPYIVNRRVVNGIQVFQRTFWTFSQCREAFKWCKPVIQVDNTHLYAVCNEAIGWQPLNAYHVFCIRHVASNFNTRFKDQELKKTLTKLGYVPNKIHFDALYAQFCSYSSEVAVWIERIPKEKWCQSYDEDGRRYII
ncbi:hypothetical protein K1719_018322 [Acacia pycnantha]|nr:hypothetical protein K1719_018322 [Acacia pycnantha]